MTRLQLSTETVLEILRFENDIGAAAGGMCRGEGPEYLHSRLHLDQPFRRILAVMKGEARYDRHLGASVMKWGQK